MKNLRWTVLLLSLIACNSKEKKKVQTTERYIVTFQQDGEYVTDTHAMQDTAFRSELQRIINDPNYKPRKLQHDTVFNAKGNPILVKLDDDNGDYIGETAYDISDSEHLEKPNKK